VPLDLPAVGLNACKRRGKPCGAHPGYFATKDVLLLSGPLYPPSAPLMSFGWSMSILNRSKRHVLHAFTLSMWAQIQSI
jgi:hypothetical protein